MTRRHLLDLWKCGPLHDLVETWDYFFANFIHSGSEKVYSNTIYSLELSVTVTLSTKESILPKCKILLLSKLALCVHLGNKSAVFIIYSNLLLFHINMCQIILTHSMHSTWKKCRKSVDLWMMDMS